METDALSKPILPAEIEWRIQSVNKQKTKTTIVPYITSRCVMSRFDEAFGMGYWQVEHQPWRTKGVKCKLSIWNNELKQWISKEDGADETHIEPTKGGFSDALKRVAVLFGLGRSLYDYPRIVLEGNHEYFPNWAYKQLDEIVQQINAGTFTRQYVELSEGTNINSKKNSPAITKEVEKAAPVMAASPVTEENPLPVTIAQKTQILLLVNNSVFTKEEKEKVSVKVNTYNTVSADNTIAYLKKIIAERSKPVAA